MIVCAPTSAPSVQLVLTFPPTSEVATRVLSAPPPVATAKVTWTPATGTSSEAVTRSTTGCASAALTVALCALPETIASRVAGRESVKVAVAEIPFSSVATTRAGPRRGSQVTVPLATDVICTASGSGVEKRTGVPGMATPCPSRAVATNVVVVPATAVPVTGTMSTETAFAPTPVGTIGTGTTCPPPAAPMGIALTGTGPPAKTVSPVALM